MVKVSADSVSGEGPTPGLQMAILPRVLIRHQKGKREKREAFSCPLLEEH
jgi:hypothetical protein